MSRQTIMTEAHKFAKANRGGFESYAAALAAGLRRAWAESKNPKQEETTVNPKTTATHRLTCKGNTRANKDLLKARGWKYDPAAQNWYMMLVDAHAQRILDGDVEFRKGLGGQLKGCQLLLDSRIVWTSKTYVDPGQRADRRDPDPEGWNCDAHGNRVATRKIDGSSPDDRI